MNPMNQGNDVVDDLFGQPMIGVSQYMCDTLRHGTVCVTSKHFKDLHINFMVDKPHKLINPTGSTIAYLFEQLSAMGLKARSIQIDCGAKPQIFQPV